MDVYQNIVAKQSVRIDIDIPGHEGRGWKRSGSSFELEHQPDLDDKWREDLTTGAKYMLQETWASASTSVIARFVTNGRWLFAGESERPSFGCKGVPVRTSVGHRQSTGRAGVGFVGEIRAK